MPHLKSAFKSLRQDVKRRFRNKSAKSLLKTQLKKFATVLDGGEAEAVKEQYRITAKMLDQTAGKGIIKKGYADRKKSQLAQKLNKLLAAGSKKKE